MARGKDCLRPFGLCGAVAWRPRCAGPRAAAAALLLVPLFVPLRAGGQKQVRQRASRRQLRLLRHVAVLLLLVVLIQYSRDGGGVLPGAAEPVRARPRPEAGRPTVRRRSRRWKSQQAFAIDLGGQPHAPLAAGLAPHDGLDGDGGGHLGRAGVRVTEVPRPCHTGVPYPRAELERHRYYRRFHLDGGRRRVACLCPQAEHVAYWRRQIKAVFSRLWEGGVLWPGSRQVEPGFPRRPKCLRLAVDKLTFTHPNYRSRSF